MSEVKRPRRVRKTFNTAVPFGAAMLLVLLLACGASSALEVKDVPVPSPGVVTSTTQATSVALPPQVTASATVSPTPSVTQAPIPSRSISQPLKETPSRLVYAAAGIDMPVAPMDQVIGPFVPPAEKGMSYWLTKRPGYLLAHSAELEKWPFNALSTAAHPGDIIELIAPEGSVKYQVTSVAFYPKHDLEIDGKTPVWDIDDSLIRLIGCKDGDVWQQVTVVTAKLL